MDNNQSAYDRERLCCERCKRRCRGRIHVINAGETLYGISRMYNVSVPEIMRANPYINVYNLRINDEICIPDRMPGNMMPGGMHGNMPGGTPNNMQGNMNNMMPFNEMPDDFFEMNDMNDGNTNNMMTGMSTDRTFTESDSVGDVLNKTGLSMAEFIDCINHK